MVIQIAKLSSCQISELQTGLLAWYDASRRDLPWRNTRDPYRIWISEIMLQQTRVAAVLPRYENFLNRFPSLSKLASSKVSTVLAEWSGLGYYHRARNLHAAARIIMRELGGEFPQCAESLRRLPGVGQYTAAAIASIAFDEPVAVLDGNVDRVLARLLGHENSRREATIAAQQVLDAKRPGDFNQAMMELGAMVCVPGEPGCAECPIKRFCATRGCGNWRREKPRQRKVSISLSLAMRGTSVLLRRRAAGEGLMAGMWELPQAVGPIGRKEILFAVRHSITVTDYKVTVVLETGTATSRGRWVPQPRLTDLPLTGLTRKILRKAKIMK